MSSLNKLSNEENKSDASSKSSAGKLDIESAPIFSTSIVSDQITVSESAEHFESKEVVADKLEVLPESVAFTSEENVLESNIIFESKLMSEIPPDSKSCSISELPAVSESIRAYDVSDDNTVPQSIPVSESIIRAYDVSDDSTVSQSIPVSESSFVLEIHTSSVSVTESNVISDTDTVQPIAIPESVATFETIAHPEQCLEFASVTVFEERAEPQSDFIMLGKLSTASGPVFEPYIVMEPDVVSEPVSVSEVVSVFEAESSNELDLEKFSRIEINEDSKVILDQNIASAVISDFEAAKISPSVSKQTATVSEGGSDILRDSPSEETKSASVLKSTAATSEVDFNPKPLKISFLNQSSKDYHRDSSSDRMFHILFDVSRCDKDKLSVNIIGDKINIYGVETSKKEFEESNKIHEVYSIPDYCHANSFAACITKDDTLHICAPFKTKESNIKVTEL